MEVNTENQILSFFGHFEDLFVVTIAITALEILVGSHLGCSSCLQNEGFYCITIIRIGEFEDPKFLKGFRKVFRLENFSSLILKGQIGVFKGP